MQIVLGKYAALSIERKHALECKHKYSLQVKAKQVRVFHFINSRRSSPALFGNNTPMTGEHALYEPYVVCRAHYKTKMWDSSLRWRGHLPLAWAHRSIPWQTGTGIPYIPGHGVDQSSTLSCRPNTAWHCLPWVGTLGEDSHHPALIRLQGHTPDPDPPHARVQGPSEGGAGWLNMGLPDATQSSPLAEGGNSHRAGTGRCQGQGTDGGETIMGAGARWVPRVNQGSKPQTCSTVLLDFT